MLHIITRSPFSSAALVDCLSFAQAKSDILLISGGVYAIRHQALTQENALNIYALAEDVEARGLEKIAGVEYINYREMVTLTEENHPIQTWS